MHPRVCHWVTENLAYNEKSRYLIITNTLDCRCKKEVWCEFIILGAWLHSTGHTQPQASISVSAGWKPTATLGSFVWGSVNCQLWCKTKKDCTCKGDLTHWTIFHTSASVLLHLSHHCIQFLNQYKLNGFFLCWTLLLTSMLQEGQFRWHVILDAPSNCNSTNAKALPSSRSAEGSTFNKDYTTTKVPTVHKISWENDQYAASQCHHWPRDPFLMMLLTFLLDLILKDCPRC